MRFPGFTGEWEKKLLGSLATKINSGKTPLGGEKAYSNEGVLFIRSQNVNNDKLELDEAVYITEATNQVMQNSIVKAKDILLNITGASLGRSCVVPEEFTIGNVNQHVCIIRLAGEYNVWFVQPILSSGKGQRIFQGLQTGSGREGLNFENIKGINLSFPTLSEQNKIAHFLSLIDNRIETQRKIIEELSVLKVGISKKMFSQELRFKKPKGKKLLEWEMKQGGEVFKSISNKEHASDLPILAISQEFGAVPREMIDYQISVTDKSIESYKVVEQGDFIISLRSFQGGIEYSYYKGICSPAYVILRNTIPINNIFYKYYLKTDDYIKKLCEKLEGIRDGKMVSYKYFSEIRLPYPSIEEQSQIANFISSIDAKITTEKVVLDKYEEQKKYLLQNLFI